MDERLLMEFVRTCPFVLNPMAAIFGGIAGQEVIKARPALPRSWANFQAPSQTRMSHSTC